MYSRAHYGGATNIVMAVCSTYIEMCPVTAALENSSPLFGATNWGSKSANLAFFLFSLESVVFLRTGLFCSFFSKDILYSVQCTQYSVYIIYNKKLCKGYISKCPILPENVITNIIGGFLVLNYAFGIKFSKLSLFLTSIVYMILMYVIFFCMTMKFYNFCFN